MRVWTEVAAQYTCHVFVLRHDVELKIECASRLHTLQREYPWPKDPGLDPEHQIQRYLGNL